MELKLSSFNLRLIITIRSNRTFMELKYNSSSVTIKGVGSNRTFMELKYWQWFF